MNRPLFKRTALLGISLALLYYSVAWAVLRCPHQENHQGHEIAVYEPGPSHRHVNLDCTGPRYHTEFLAGPSTNSELLRLTRGVASHGIFVGFSGFALNQIEDVWRIALSDQVSSAALPFDLPRYLSLSVLRF